MGRFADDVLLFGSSKEQLPKMMYEFKESTEKVGPRIHPGKTKVFSNQSSLSPDSKKEIQIDDVKIDILTRSESVRYSGQLITLQEQETTEIRNRIRAAWATFHKYRQELTSKNYMLKTSTPAIRRSDNSDDMLRIGNMGTTNEHERMIQSTQRKMLRLIIQTKR